MAFKQFELSNHLGNVLATILDGRTLFDTVVIINDTYNDTFAIWDADMVAAQDYYAFGMQMPSRTYANTNFVNSQYRYGYNGQESDDEWNGNGNSYAYEYRINDPRISRFLSIDPLEREYPWNSSYAFAENRVIDGGDLEGKEWKSKHKWSDQVSDDHLKSAYGTQLITIMGEDGKNEEQIEAWKLHKGETYNDLWRTQVPKLQKDHLDKGEKHDCANFSIYLLYEFAYTNDLPILLEGHSGTNQKAKFDNDKGADGTYTYTDKDGNVKVLEEGDWQSAVKAAGSAFSAGDLHSRFNKFVKDKDNDKIEPGDLIAVLWGGKHSWAGHNQTVHSSKTGGKNDKYRTIQGSLEGQFDVLNTSAHLELR